MSSNKQGKLVLYSGPSGVGKGSILSEVMRRDPKVKLSVSNTTRDPREGEIHGVHYFYITREEFENLIAQDGFLEYAEYCDNYYGTPKRQVKELLDKGFDVFLEIEVKGAMQIMSKYPDILSIFVLPPSIEELERRLRSRGTEDEETIQKRLEKAKSEMAMKDKYRYRVINDDLDAAVDKVLSIIKGRL